MKKKIKKRDLELNFEIEFFEKLIKEKPDYVDALIPLAEAYTKIGGYEKGLLIDQKLAKFKPDDPVIHYNLACSYSLLNMIEDALRTLSKAIKLGYRDFRLMETDPDLSLLRKDKRYQKLISNLKKTR